MYKFAKEQRIYQIGKIKIGGQPGENPTVLAGTIFYGGHKIVSDPKEGTFDKEKAEFLIKRQEEMSDITGNPCMVQVFSESIDAMKKYIDFVASITDSPFLIDSTEPKVRAEGAKYAKEVGLADRAIYNSINASITEEELRTLKELKMVNSIVLAFNPTDPSIKGKVAILTTGGGLIKKGLLEIANECGVKAVLIDVAATALGSGAGAALASTYVIKSKFGYPTGSGIHNVVSAWPWLKRLRKEIPTGKEIFKYCDIASNVLQVMVGGNFVLYGPIENAEYVFPVIAMTDALVTDMACMELGLAVSDSHPYKRLVG
ncbi:MAG: tetrahydromethanopterin S-methyltransferase subunit H [Candidatus Nezhaarchaeota archaeon]|nr:tetrahydromethanopterin S-methyltransferase subunit H [Candidatus Nezhaarchaeota archaeon]MDW8049740.1 tetrahydromethanopterin S-methyltransferase subunit H [Nitrososphaerota archaeon]